MTSSQQQREEVLDDWNGSMSDDSFEDREPYAHDSITKILEQLNELHDSGWRLRGSDGFVLTSGHETVVLYHDQFTWDYEEES